MKNPLGLLLLALGVYWMRALWASYVRKSERTGMRVAGVPCWSITQVTDAAAWVRALSLLEPLGAVLYLEGAHDPAVVALLEERAYPNPTPVGPLTTWPRQPFYHMAATPENLEELARLMESGEVERLAFHAVLYREHHVILEWYEAFCPPDEQGVFLAKGEITEVTESPMLAPGEVPEERVRAFATALGAAFRRWEAQP